MTWKAPSEDLYPLISQCIDLSFLCHRPPKSTTRTRHSLSQTVPSFWLYFLRTRKYEIPGSTGYEEVRGWRIADEVVTRPVRRQSPPRNLQQSGSLLGKRRNCPRGGVHSGNLPSLRHQQDTALTGQAPRPAPAAPRVVLNPPSRLDGFVSQGPVFVLEGSDRFQMRGRRMCVSLR